MADHDRELQEVLGRIETRVVVFSGKGGVGKTTVSVNLAHALAGEGRRVGLLDADITGPNVSRMMGDRGSALGRDGVMIPREKGGVKFISTAALIPSGSPVIWRGPLRSKALEQMIWGVDWGALDVLVVDLPPGTGDEVLTITDRAEPQVAVIVTTPQKVSLMDAERAVNMALQMEIPRIGIVENMSGFVCPECGSDIPLFGQGGGELQARKLGVEFFGRIPVELEVCRGGDDGRPIVRQSPEAPVSRAFLELAATVAPVRPSAEEEREQDTEAPQTAETEMIP